jgi:formate hydrogenlyase subunit 3/multisubunit Na+/H+ antiporter MnhD subunit
MILGVGGFSAGGIHGVDEVGIAFGSLFAAIWLLGAVYSASTVPRRERARFFAFYVPAAVGGIAVAFVGDAISFYFCFTLMAVSSWGLVSHERTTEARRAGAIYLGLTALGEAALLAALMVLVAEAGSIDLAAVRSAMPEASHAGLAFGLLVVAFALKLGAFCVSGALPLTYAYTPSGAAAALAGASVKVGVLGMLRLLPLGEAVPPSWGVGLVVLGLTSVFGGAILGLLTTSPKAVLGYSSSSQMGFVMIAIGAGLAEPTAAGYAIAAAVAYSLHHGLAKTALFMGEDVVKRISGRARVIGFALLSLPAFALAGAPLTSGFVAKNVLKYALHEVPGSLPHVAETLLPWGAVATSLLMLRFFALAIASCRDAASGSVLPGGTRALGGSLVPAVLWAITLVLVLTAVWVWPAEWSREAVGVAGDPASLWGGVWPIAVASFAALAGRAATRANPRLRGGVVAPGDVLLLVGRVTANLFVPTVEPSEAVATKPRARVLAPILRRIEATWTAWGIAAAVFVVLAIILVVASV